MPQVTNVGVIRLNAADSPTGTGTFTGEELRNTLEQRIGILPEGMMTEGTPAQYMDPTTGWQQGRLRIAIEFIPDTPALTPPTPAPLTPRTSA